MSFRTKYSQLTILEPDIMIIQECEFPEKFPFEFLEKYSVEWFGDNHNKGIAIITEKTKVKVYPLEFNFENNRWFVPLLTDSGLKFIAVWAMNKRKNKIIERTAPTLRTILTNEPSFKNVAFVIGDFNNNKIFADRHNKRYNTGTFEDIVSELKKYDLESVYHLQNKEEFGGELIPTLTWMKNRNKQYHVDYCFVNQNLLKKLTRFQIMADTNWLKYSDHYPLIVEFDENQN